MRVMAGLGYTPSSACEGLYDCEFVMSRVEKDSNWVRCARRPPPRTALAALSLAQRRRSLWQVLANPAPPEQPLDQRRVTYVNEHPQMGERRAEECSAYGVTERERKCSRTRLASRLRYW